MGNSVLPSVRLNEGLPAASAQPCGSPCAAHLDWHLCGLWARAAGSQVVGLMCGPWAHLAGYPGSPPSCPWVVTMTHRLPASQDQGLFPVVRI